MLLEPRVLEVVALVAAGVAVLALVVAAVAVARLGRLHRLVDGLTGGDEGLPFVAAMERQLAASDGLRTDVRMLKDDLSAARADLSDALRHVAVVRYDAFADMGGRLSFSAALLDDAGDGLVLTSINSRSETRTYAKGVLGGSSEHQLSPEEEQAIAHATQAAAGTDRRGRRGAAT